MPPACYHSRASLAWGDERFRLIIDFVARAHCSPLTACSPQVFKDRVWILNNETAYGMARWIHAHGPVTPLNSRRFAALIRNTVDFLAAGLAAPVGESGAMEPAPKDVSR